MKNQSQSGHTFTQRRKGAKNSQRISLRRLCDFASLREIFCASCAKQKLVMAFLFGSFALSPSLFAQIRTGASFLRMMPGARQQGIAASTTGVIDEFYTIYANPGATGLLREWQWSASYSKWI